MSRTVQRAFSFLRPASRTSYGVRPVFSRRSMASSAPHASHGGQSSDTPWMIGSALVFGPVMLYLLSPSARKTSHSHSSEHSHGNASHHAEPQPTAETPALKDDESVEVSGGEIKDSMEKAFDADSPKDAQEHEEAVAKGEDIPVESSSSDAVPHQENTEPTTSETDVTSEEKTELEGTQPEPSATNEAGGSTEEVVEEKH